MAIAAQGPDLVFLPTETTTRTAKRRKTLRKRRRTIRKKTIRRKRKMTTKPWDTAVS